MSLLTGADDIKRVRLAAGRLGEGYRRRRTARRFDAQTLAGKWRVAFSSAIAETLENESKNAARRETVTELSIARSALRSFPRLSAFVGRFALRSIEFEVRPSASGVAFDTIVSLRNRAAPFPAPALRLEHSLIASKSSDAAMINERVRIEPAADRFSFLPKPALPTNWLPSVNPSLHHPENNRPRGGV